MVTLIVPSLSAPMMVWPSGVKVAANGSFCAGSDQALPQRRLPSCPSTATVNGISRTRGGLATVSDPG